MNENVFKILTHKFILNIQINPLGSMYFHYQYFKMNINNEAYKQAGLHINIHMHV